MEWQESLQITFKSFKCSDSAMRHLSYEEGRAIGADHVSPEFTGEIDIPVTRVPTGAAFTRDSAVAFAKSRTSPDVRRMPPVALTSTPGR